MEKYNFKMIVQNLHRKINEHSYIYILLYDITFLKNKLSIPLSRFKKEIILISS